MTALHEKAAPGGADDDRAAENGSADHVADDRVTSESIGYGGAYDVYNRLGWSGLPVPRPEKYPPPKGYTGRGGLVPSYADMCTWAEQYPDANVALRLPEGIVGIDVDAYNGKTGGETLAEAEKRCGKLPPTYRSTSRDDGVSGIRFYRVPDGIELRDGISFPELGLGGIDTIQSHHRYAMAWPSIHPSGAAYKWIAEIDMGVMDQPPAVGDLPDLPARWLEMLRSEPARNGADLAPEAAYNVADALTAGTPSLEVLARLTEALSGQTGSRHDSTRDHSLALLRLGKDGEPGVKAALTMLGNAFVDAVTAEGTTNRRTRDEANGEWRRMIYGDRVARLLAEESWTDGGGQEISGPDDPADGPTKRKTKAAQPDRRIIWRTAAEIRDGIPEWAWTYNGRGRIMRSTLNLFAGRPAAGKSTAARYFAARYSNGTMEGCFYGVPQTVAYIASEESIEYMIKPSLRAVGADMDRIIFPTVETDGNQVRLLSTVDEAALTKDLKARGVTVVFVDPVMSSIGSTVDINRNNETRAYIEPWARIAAAINGLVTGVVHLTKAPGGDIVAAINGSSAFGEVARSVIAFAKDPQSEDGHRVCSQEKNSAGDEDLALIYTIETTTVQTDEGPAEVGRFAIIGPSDRRVGDVLRSEASQKRLGERAGEVLEAARQAPGSITPLFISTSVAGMSNDDAGQYLRRLAENGLLSKVSRGVYEYRRA